jgi:hypothetical protein
MSSVVLLGVLASALLVGTPAIAQVYPYTNPTYTPNIRMTPVAIASGVASTTQTLNGIGVVAVQLSGTCTSLVGRLEGSLDGTNWVTLNLFPNQALGTASAVQSVTTTGLWTSNTSGINLVRFNNSAASGTACVATLAGSPRGFVLPR